MGAKNNLLTTAAYLDNPGGIYEVEFSNENIMVDEEYGYNLTTLHIDMAQADHVAPTLTMLQLRDADGIVSDRFDSAKGCQVRLSAGDFTYCPYQNREDWGWFTCQPLSRVTVAYAPRNTEQWHGLSAVEQPEYYMMPGFGHYYEADLSGIGVEEENSWFDLKIRVTDTSGNWQEQLISPAFKVAQTQEAVTGIHSVSENDEQIINSKSAHSKGFNLQGQRVADNFKGIVISNGKKVVR